MEASEMIAGKPIVIIVLAIFSYLAGVVASFAVTAIIYLPRFNDCLAFSAGDMRGCVFGRAAWFLIGLCFVVPAISVLVSLRRNSRAPRYGGNHAE
jgi:hypothetical protein